MSDYTIDYTQLGAQSRMRGYDRMPREWRDLCKEYDLRAEDLYHRGHSPERAKEILDNQRRTDMERKLNAYNV